MGHIKKLFQGNKGKFVIAAIVIVAILGLYMWRKNSGGNTPVVETDYAAYTPNTDAKNGASAGNNTPDITREDVVGMFQDYNTVVQDAIKEQSEQTKIVAESFKNELSYQQSGFNQTFIGIISGLGALTEKVNEGLLSHAWSKLETASQKPVYDEPSNVVPMTNPKYGLGGINYNTATKEQKTQLEKNEKRLETDSSYRESELARAKKVQQDRGMAGLDTSAQDAYIKKLEAAG